VSERAAIVPIPAALQSYVPRGNGTTVIALIILFVDESKA